MKAKYRFILIVLISFASVCFGQRTNDTFRINNDSVNFVVLRTTPDWEKDQFYSESIIQVKSVNTLHFKKIRKKEWLKLLAETNYDWAANLVLYQLYRKSASIFRIVTSRNKWISEQKEADVAYWRIHLK